jgi:hypothetical protein
MTAQLRKVDERPVNEPLVLELSSREAPMTMEYADRRVPGPHDPSARRLRNYIILANFVAWIAIIALIRLFFS